MENYDDCAYCYNPIEENKSTDDELLLTTEQYIQLLELLSLYQRKLEQDQRYYRSRCYVEGGDTKDNFALLIMVADHIRVIEQIRQCICYEF